ncbi:uncharacterized protein V1510DRAFT_407681 [Dipodascopsis tothii]|uniref:uncharacterized protein n=1 Tax=Dipodascopsis tothii TaxID=44089 RepID=UPI0034CDB460
MSFWRQLKAWPARGDGPAEPGLSPGSDHLSTHTRDGGSNLSLDSYRRRERSVRDGRGRAGSVSTVSERDYELLQQSDGYIFGVPLEESLAYASATVWRKRSNGDRVVYGPLPTLVALCGIYLQENAQSVEGIFRLSGSVRRIRELQQIFATPPQFGDGIDWTNYTVHDASNVLRRYLNKLPEPIIPLEDYADFRAPFTGPTLPKKREIINTLQRLIWTMPVPRKQLLIYLLDLLDMFAHNSRRNLMPVANLAAIFQPCMLTHPDHALSPEEYRVSQDCVAFLIEYRSHFNLEPAATSRASSLNLFHLMDGRRKSQSSASSIASAMALGVPSTSSTTASGAATPADPVAQGTASNRSSIVIDQTEDRSPAATSRRYLSGLRRNRSSMKANTSNGAVVNQSSGGGTTTNVKNKVQLMRSQTVPTKRSFASHVPADSARRAPGGRVAVDELPLQPPAEGEGIQRSAFGSTSSAPIGGRRPSNMSEVVVTDDRTLDRTDDPDDDARSFEEGLEILVTRKRSDAAAAAAAALSASAMARTPSSVSRTQSAPKRRRSSKSASPAAVAVTRSASGARVSRASSQTKPERPLEAATPDTTCPVLEQMPEQDPGERTITEHAMPVVLPPATGPVAATGPVSETTQPAPTQPEVYETTTTRTFAAPTDAAEPAQPALPQAVPADRTTETEETSFGGEEKSFVSEATQDTSMTTIVDEQHFEQRQFVDGTGAQHTISVLTTETQQLVVPRQVRPRGEPRKRPSIARASSPQPSASAPTLASSLSPETAMPTADRVPARKSMDAVGLLERPSEGGSGSIVRRLSGRRGIANLFTRSATRIDRQSSPGTLAVEPLRPELERPRQGPNKLRKKPPSRAATRPTPAAALDAARISMGASGPPRPAPQRRSMSTGPPAKMTTMSPWRRAYQSPAGSGAGSGLVPAGTRTSGSFAPPPTVPETGPIPVQELPAPVPAVPELQATEPANRAPLPPVSSVPIESTEASRKGQRRLWGLLGRKRTKAAR